MESILAGLLDPGTTKKGEKVLLSPGYRATDDGYLYRVLVPSIPLDLGGQWARVVARRKSDQSLPVDFHNLEPTFLFPSLYGVWSVFLSHRHDEETTVGSLIPSLFRWIFFSFFIFFFFLYHFQNSRWREMWSLAHEGRL